MRKYDIVRAVALKVGCRDFLEISTPSTGHTFVEGVESEQFDLCQRLVYRCPADYDDGLPITFRTKDDGCSELIANLTAAFGQPRYDMIFVDSWHTLDCSALDLFGAWSLLRPGGVMVVHDCNPPRFEITSPTPPEPDAEWTGVTYQAFVEFLLCGFHERVFTVDADYGVGVVFKGSQSDAAPNPTLQARHCLPWHLLRGNQRRLYNYFTQHCRELIGLLTISEFADLFGLVLIEETIHEVDLDDWAQLTAAPPQIWFDEGSYRKIHVDVATAVKRGSVASGLEHFMNQGAYEGRIFRRLDRKGTFILSPGIRDKDER